MTSKTNSEEFDKWFAEQVRKTDPARGMMGFGGTAPPRMPEPAKLPRELSPKIKRAKKIKAAEPVVPCQKRAARSTEDGQRAPTPWGDPTKATAADALLMSANELASQFTMSALVVQAWKDCPFRFGLEGYRGTYPDSNAVKANLFAKVGGRSPLFNGHFKVVEPAVYEITPSGRKRIVEIGRRLSSQS